MTQILCSKLLCSCRISCLPALWTYNVMCEGGCSEQRVQPFQHNTSGWFSRNMAMMSSFQNRCSTQSTQRTGFILHILQNFNHNGQWQQSRQQFEGLWSEIGQLNDPQKLCRQRLRECDKGLVRHDPSWGVSGQCGAITKKHLANATWWSLKSFFEYLHRSYERDKDALEAVLEDARRRAIVDIYFKHLDAEGAQFSTTKFEIVI